jgi:hypothetical protein
MSAMNTVEHADGEVGILQVEVFERMIMIHGGDLPQRHRVSEFFLRVSVPLWRMSLF